MAEETINTVEVRVPMDCPGCERKIRKALTSVPGLHAVSMDKELQKVIVRGDPVMLDRMEVLRRLQKVRKNADFWLEEPPPPCPELCTAYCTTCNTPSTHHYVAVPPTSSIGGAHTCDCSVCSPHSYNAWSYAAPHNAASFHRPYLYQSPFPHHFSQYPHYLHNENPNGCSVM